MNCELMLTYDTPALRQTGSRNLTGKNKKKSRPTDPNFEDHAIGNTCIFFFWPKNQQSRQTGSRNLMGPKTLPTIWSTNMKLVTKYQISAINSC